MKCYKCKFYNEGQNYYNYWNECKKFKFEYFHTYYEEECPYIDNDYYLTDEGVYLAETL